MKTCLLLEEEKELAYRHSLLKAAAKPRSAVFIIHSFRSVMESIQEWKIIPPGNGTISEEILKVGRKIMLSAIATIETTRNLRKPISYFLCLILYYCSGTVNVGIPISKTFDSGPA